MAPPLKMLSRKMDEVISRQTRTLGLVSIPEGGGMLSPSENIDTSDQSEINVLLTNQKAILSAVLDIHKLINQVHSRAEHIIQNQKRPPTAEHQTPGNDVQSLITEIRDGITQIKQSMVDFGLKTEGESDEPTSSGCCCTFSRCVGFVLFLIIFLLVFLIIRIFDKLARTLGI